MVGICWYVIPDVNLIFFTLLVAQKNEKEEAATQQALTDAIWSEQRQEELNGFHKRNLKVPGNPTLSSLFLIELERTPARWWCFGGWVRGRWRWTPNGESYKVSTKYVIDIISLLRSSQVSPSLQLSRRLNAMAVPWSIAFSLRIPVLTRKYPRHWHPSLSLSNRKTLYVVCLVRVHLIPPWSVTSWKMYMRIMKVSTFLLHTARAFSFKLTTATESPSLPRCKPSPWN